MKAISMSELNATRERTLVIDVRRTPAFRDSPEMISGALRRDPEAVGEWAGTLPAASGVAVYCVHGHEVSQGVVKALTAAGRQASYLEGGIEEWKAKQGPLDSKPKASSTRWVTRERPKIDRIACPWLISRFADRDAEFLYVPTKEVLSTAKAKDAVPYDVPDVHFTHDGERCSFDAFIKHYRLGGDPALQKLALIVRAADTGKLGIAKEAPGLAALSLGLSRIFQDDLEMLDHGMVMYDALYAWCKDGQAEVHTWKPEAYR